jgi:hypothetical protein
MGLGGEHIADGVGHRVHGQRDIIAAPCGGVQAERAGLGAGYSIRTGFISINVENGSGQRARQRHSRARNKTWAKTQCPRSCKAETACVGSQAMMAIERKADVQ